jgi:Trypsin-like peptidase domain
MIFIDGRLGGSPQWVIGDPGDLDMGVPRELIDCVCFICAKINGRMRIGGTGFVIGMPGAQVEHLYVVTARHCIREINNLGGDVYLRFNTVNNGAPRDFKVLGWHFPESPAVDLAVLSLHLPPNSDLYFRALPSNNIVTKDTIDWREIGPGDELLITGLFSKLSGTQRNYPVVRAGIIAAMPDEPIVDDDGTEFEGYLVEVRSIGGLSGSPVFLVYRPKAPSILSDKRGDIIIRREVPVLAPQTYYLLGVVRAHWDTPGALKPLFDDEIVTLNMGIAVVTPASEILNVLKSDPLKNERAERLAEVRAKNAPTPD